MRYAGPLLLFASLLGACEAGLVEELGVDSGSGAGAVADAGPQSHDAGAAADAGPQSHDAGAVADAGPQSHDAGAVADAGPQSHDAGAVADAGPQSHDAGAAADAGTKKTFFDYILPTPITCPLTMKTWGCTASQVAGKQSSCGSEDQQHNQMSGPVVPRDTCNGIESAKEPPDYYYWDGKIIRATDGLYHMIVDRWPDANQGFQNYTSSAAVHAVSDTPLGPYEETGYSYSYWSSGDPHRGHNTTAIALLDGTYALTTGEGGVAPFTVWTSPSLDGPWTACSTVKPDANFEIIDTNGLNLSYFAGPLDSNVSIVARPDGQFEIVQRRGMIGLASNVCGPYKLQQPTNTYPSDQQPPADIPSIYPDRKKHTDPLVGTPNGPPATPQPTYTWAEDPVIWFSGGKYHVLYDYPIDRVGYHLTSLDGIQNWTDEGFAYDPRMSDKIFSYTDGTAVGWYKMERPGVLMENGHVTHLTFAVSDVDKDSQIPANSSHGSKIIVIPFDGVQFDCDTGQGACDDGRDAGTATGGKASTDGSVGARARLQRPVRAPSQ